MMKNKKIITSCTFPERSRLFNELWADDYHDSYELSLCKSKLDPLSIYLLMVNKTPAWINLLLTFRNKLMSMVGLKDVGNLGGIELINFSDNSIFEGAKLDIFTIDSLTPEEMILRLDDRHLDIKMSILIKKEDDYKNIFVSTTVKFHNFWGKLYMFVIAPFHKRIVKRLLMNVANEINK